MFSIITPLDTNRLEQFKITKQAYDAMPQKKEFLIPTREIEKVDAYLTKHRLLRNVEFIPYEHERGFNCSKALNLGVRNAAYDHIVITSPEVKPTTDVLGQFKQELGKNLICQVWDENDSGKVMASLVHKGYRDDTPAMYFLALFNKSDIEKINGWDEDFMKGYAYEDNDFGERWNRAGLPFEVREDIQGVHQYHPRTETIRGGMATNKIKFDDNNDKGIITPENGLKQV